MNEYFKDFDKWNEIIKTINSKNSDREIFFREQEIWWCSMGVNIGSEIDGKNELFERPVIIIRRFNKDILLVAPITSNLKDQVFRIPIRCGKTESQIILTQCRIISSKRLLRRIGCAKQNVYQASLLGLIRLILGF